MADILIFGMKMPENEPLRLVLNPNGQLFVDHGVTFTEYEAVELPEHVDLIDRSELNNSFESSDFDGEPYDNVYSAICVVNSMPAIVPSNKEDAE